MFGLNVTSLEVLLIGKPGIGKANFIRRFLEYFPPSAEVRRRHATVYCLYLPNQGFRIQLYDVDCVENMDRSSYEKMDVVLFYYAAVNLGSLRSKEKWTSFMGVDAKKEIPSFQTKKEAISILMVDWGNLDYEPDSNELDMANSLKDDLGFKYVIQNSSEDDESTCKVLQIIMREISQPKKKKSSNKKKSCEKRTVHKEVFDQHLNAPSSPSSTNCAERHLEDIRQVEFSLQELQV